MNTPETQSGGSLKPVGSEFAPPKGTTIEDWTELRVNLDIHGKPFHYEYTPNTELRHGAEPETT